MTSPSLIWFRKDLRLTDNPALHAALKRQSPVICLFVLDDETEGSLPMGGASAWWLHHSLAALDTALRDRGGKLILRRGQALPILEDLCQAADVGAVYWNRCYDPAAIDRDTAVKKALTDAGVTVESFNGSLLREPWEVKTKTGGPYSVFTPFWKASCALGEPDRPTPAPETLPGYSGDLDGEALESWSLLPTKPDWAGGLRETWQPGEEGARARFDAFLDEDMAGYGERRNRPDWDRTSRLSPHLAFGELSVREIWHAALGHARFVLDGDESGAWSFLREVGWRDFNHNLLFHNPDMPTVNFHRKFDAFPWRQDEDGFQAWCRGRTGYPLVDAGMRELWHTGFMHNRVRMVAASFLIKHLLVDWRRGEAWFRDTLVDADLANNVCNWQWVAGCGADAAPYFRIFNPTGQAEKFDPDQAYIRRWVPELARGGEDYPGPIVDHKMARQRALDAYADIKGAA